MDIEAIRKGPQLNEAYREKLTYPVTEIEIWEAIKSIGETKALGIDWYTSKFFKSTYNITKQDIIKVVQDFFRHNRLFVADNCALVTLIPKYFEAKMIKDMRPIT